MIIATLVASVVSAAGAVAAAMIARQTQQRVSKIQQNISGVVGNRWENITQHGDGGGQPMFHISSGGDK